MFCILKGCTKIREGARVIKGGELFILLLKSLTVLFNSQPMTMTQMEKIFSELVFGETLPNPTLVKLLKVK